MTVLAFVASVVVGIGVGVLSHIVGPSVAAKLEQERERRGSRRERIKEWRRMVDNCLTYSHVVHTQPEYLSLRAHLPDDLRKRLDLAPGEGGNPITIIQGAQGVASRADLRDLVTRVDQLERDWK